MASQVTLKALGLNYSPNNLALPEGSLIVADDVIIRRDNVIESRRGFKEYSEDFGASSDRSKQIIVYKERILNHYNNLLQYDTGTIDSDGKAIFETFSGTYNEVETGLRIKSIEANKNLYFTTNEGIKKIAARSPADLTTNSGFIQSAGGIKSLDFDAELNTSQGQSTGFLPADSAVAYKTLWGYKDLNDNLILGTPSDSVSVYNFLESIIPLDLNAFLLMLDNIAQSNPTVPVSTTYASVLHNVTSNGADTFAATESFSSKFGVDINEDPTLFASKLIDTANYLDKFSLLADTNAITNIKPLRIGKIENSTGVGTVTFASTYNFTITSAAVVAGDVYINNNQVYTMISSGALTSINMTGYGSPITPSPTNTLTRISGTGPATLTYSAFTETSNAISDVFSANDYFQIQNAVDSTNLYTIVVTSVGGTGGIAVGDVLTNGTNSTSFIAVTSLSNTSGDLKVIGTGAPPTPSPSATLNRVIGTGFTSITYTAAPTVVASTYSILNNTTTGTNPKPFWQITSVNDVTKTIKFNTPSTFAETYGAFPGSTTQIFPYNCRYIISNGDNTFSKPLDQLVVDTPATHEQLSIIQHNIERLVTRLQSEKVKVIATKLQDDYTNQYTTTSAANVDLTITIPTTILNNKDYFLQVYRTRNFTCTDSDILGVTVIPDEEFRLVYEAFPSNAQSLAGFVTFQDTYPEELRNNNVNLYTNPITGEGALQANDVPPICKDINRFKNVLFYANTKTRHRLNPFQLLGTSAINAGDSITISDGTTSGTQTYVFVDGVAQQTEVLFPSGVTPANIKNRYFTIYSAKDIKKYYVWFRLDNTNITFSNVTTSLGITTFTTTSNHNIPASPTSKVLLSGLSSSNDINGEHTINVTGLNTFEIAEDCGVITSFSSADAIPYVDDASGLRVDILTGDTTNIIRNKTVYALNSLALDFISEGFNTYTFSVSGSPTVTAGDTYSNNGITYTVISLVGSTLTCVGISDPTVSGTLQRVFGNGSSSISFISFSTTNFSINITNTDSGITTDAVDGNIGGAFVTINTPVDGNGENPNASPPEVLLAKPNGSTTAAQAINQTARSLVRMINKQPNSTINAYYTSNSSSLPGQINLESKLINDIPFYVQASNVEVGASFNPNLEPIEPDENNITRTSGTEVTFTTSSPHGLNNQDKIFLSLATVDVTSPPSFLYLNGIYAVQNTTSNTFKININTVPFNSDTYKFAWSRLSNVSVSNNEIKKNRVYYSKLLQPEAVPLLNYFDIGSEDEAILRIFPLRDSLFVFKEDGLFRISGETAPFVVTLFDTSCVLIAPDTVSVANNIIYGWTTKGISNVTEAGVTEISRQIDTTILKLASVNYTNFKTASWGLGYDSDNSYTVYTCAETDDEVATVGFRFSNLTNTWTNFKRSQTCGVINPVDDRIYTGSGTNNVIDQERKNFDRTDYSDRDFNATLLNNFYTVDGRINLTSVAGISRGDSITQVQGLTVYKYNALLDKLDFDPSVGKYGYTTNTLGNKTITINTLVFGTSTPLNHNLSTGDFIDISSSNTVPSIDGQYEITVTGPNTFTIEIPEVLISGTVGVLNSLKRDYSRIFEAKTGNNLRTKLVNLAIYLDTDPGLTPPINVTYSDIIASKSGDVGSVIANNPAQIVSSNPSLHELIDGRVVTISGINTTIIPSIQDTYQVNVTGTFPSNFTTSTSFEIPVNVTTGQTVGSTGLTYNTGNNLLTVEDILACYNGIVKLLNEPLSGTFFKNYPSITETTLFEALVVDVNKKDTFITINLPIQLVVGEVKFYKAIQCNVIYSPITFGDPLQLKQVYEATLMLANRAFTRVTAGFSSDLKPEFTYVDFLGQGNGMFGHYSQPGFGYGFFGGSSNSAPCRTLIPRQNQRCRYINMQFIHNTSRELWSLYGITLTLNQTQSTRAYR